MKITLAETFTFMRQAHHLQVDKSGQPYWQHPLRVMYRLGPQATAAERHAALLHDVIEDCPVTYDDLRARGYSEAAIEIVRLVSKDPQAGLTFRQWITALAASGNVAAMRVKLADLADNLSPARLKTLPPEMRGIDRRFRMAWQIIAERLPEEEVKGIIRGDVPPLAEIERAFALNPSTTPT